MDFFECWQLYLIQGVFDYQGGCCIVDILRGQFKVDEFFVFFQFKCIKLFFEEVFYCFDIVVGDFFDGFDVFCVFYGELVGYLQ